MAAILVVGPAWVGDMVMAQSLFITLRQRYPEHAIDVIAPAWSLPLLQRMPQIRHAVALQAGHGQFALLQRWQLGRQLQDNHYAQAIVLPRSWKSALIPFFASATLRTGYRGEMRYGLLNDIRRLDKTVLTQTVQRYVALGQDITATLPPPIPYPKLQVDRENGVKLRNRLQLTDNRPVVAMMPGAEYGPAKQWPIGFYAAVAKRLLAQGYQIWVLGSRKDSAAGSAITMGCGEQGHNLCGKTELVDTIDLLAQASVAISNDSGLMHIAAAVDTPVVAIYGSSSPAYTPPLTDRATILYLGLSCSPCFARECKYQHTHCLQQITPQQVESAVLAATKK